MIQGARKLDSSTMQAQEPLYLDSLFPFRYVMQSLRTDEGYSRVRDFYVIGEAEFP
jgi:hypothetical protein